MPTSRRDQGRGERVLPGLWRLRLPLPWPGIPHCNAWVLAKDGGYVLIDTGMYDSGSMDQLERAMQQVKLDLSRVSLLAITHAHSDHWGQSAPIVERAECAMWMHPNHGAQFANLSDPDRALTRRMEVARHSGVPDGALTEYVKRAKDMPSGIAAAIEPDQPLVDGVTIDTDLGPWQVLETPGHTPSHVCFFQPERRLLISGDHLLGRISLYFDYGQSEDPVGEYLGSLDKVQAVRARLALSGHGKPFLDVPGHIDSTRRLVSENIDRATAAVTAQPRTAMTIALDMFREQRGARHPAWLLSQTLCYLRHLQQAGHAQQEVDGELQFWRATGS
jgi:glyoxylase-like metal-dependent hydrolase (beta-lactamase superfamily II)